MPWSLQECLMRCCDCEACRYSAKRPISRSESLDECGEQGMVGSVVLEHPQTQRNNQPIIVTTNVCFVCQFTEDAAFQYTLTKMNVFHIQQNLYRYTKRHLYRWDTYGVTEYCDTVKLSELFQLIWKASCQWFAMIACVWYQTVP